MNIIPCCRRRHPANATPLTSILKKTQIVCAELAQDVINGTISGGRAGHDISAALANEHCYQAKQLNIEIAHLRGREDSKHKTEALKVLTNSQKIHLENAEKIMILGPLYGIFFGTIIGGCRGIQRLCRMVQTTSNQTQITTLSHAPHSY